MYSVLADVVLALHLLFVAFVVAGGLFALRWPRVVWIHAPAALWGVLIEYAGWICPLTPLENHLRARAGEATYESDFIARYALPLLYPEGLTREMQVALGTLALGVNVAVYGWVLTKRKTARGRR